MGFCSNRWAPCVNGRVPVFVSWKEKKFYESTTLPSQNFEFSLCIQKYQNSFWHSKNLHKVLLYMIFRQATNIHWLLEKKKTNTDISLSIIFSSESFNSYFKVPWNLVTLKKNSKNVDMRDERDYTFIVKKLHMKRITDSSVLKLWYVIQNRYLEWEKYGGQMIIIFVITYKDFKQKSIFLNNFVYQICNCWLKNFHF